MNGLSNQYQSEIDIVELGWRVAVSLFFDNCKGGTRVVLTLAFVK